MIKRTDFKLVNEGTTNVLVSNNKSTSKGPGSKEKVPFYNPSMELNRDLSIVLCQFFVNNSSKKVSLLDGLAASGIRGFRIIGEVEGDYEVFINDWDEEAFKLIEENYKNSNKKNVKIFNKNLNTILSENKFDYIDIDPFGSPVYFIDSAMRSICNNGIIAITATDTAALCGVYPKVCLRRYGAKSFHSYVMHEIGLRILLGVLCRQAAVYKKGIEPLVSYSTDHYFRIYVRVRKGVDQANDAMKNFLTINSKNIPFSKGKNVEVGPLWMGKLQNKKVIRELRTILFEKELKTKNNLWKLLDLLEGEADAPSFFYESSILASIWKKSPPKMKTIFEELVKKDFFVCRTHFTTSGFKTDAPLSEIEKLFK